MFSIELHDEPQHIILRSVLVRSVAKTIGGTVSHLSQKISVWMLVRVIGGSERGRGYRGKATRLPACSLFGASLSWAQRCARETLR
jgi:hypothetical protein